MHLWQIAQHDQEASDYIYRLSSTNVFRILRTIYLGQEKIHSLLQIFDNTLG